MRSHLRFFGDAVRVNLQISLEYRVSFISQVFGMLLNDVMWIVFWTLFFGRFKVINGWGIEDVLTIWAITATGFGIAAGFFGNANNIARVIAQGELDYYLGLPKNVLLHLLINKMNLTALGDLIFGFGVFAFFLHPAPERIALFLVLSVCSAAALLGFLILVGSLTFWMGNTEGLTMQAFNAIITLSTYPTPLFNGGIKLLMFSAVPAWFVAHLPTSLLRRFDLADLLLELAASAAILALSVLVFYRGLRRYESGNLMVLRS
ncbi:MAG: ABC transporter permease [Chloroflexia bacterium]